MTGSAKQSMAQQCGKVDCFVALLLAMTVEIEFRSNQKQRKNLP